MKGELDKSGKRAVEGARTKSASHRASKSPGKRPRKSVAATSAIDDSSGKLPGKLPETLPANAGVIDAQKTSVDSTEHAAAPASASLALANSKPAENVELFPHGISVGSTVGRPVLILKDKAMIEVLPVWMHPLDAGVALAELSQGSGASPHSVTKRVLEMAGLSLTACVFVEIIGHHQFIDLVFSNPQGVETNRLRVRADEAMSFCLQARAKFFSSKDFMLRCRALDADLTSLEHNLNEGQLPGLQAEMENSSKKHPYVM